MSLGFYVDLSSCIGCRTCQVACKDRRDIQVAGPRLRRVDSFECGTYPDVAMFHLNTSCNHCESPACVANCPTGAMQKDPETGIVNNDKEKCIGCMTCEKSCPYGHPVQLDDGLSHKCVLCSDENPEGTPDPTCAKACPVRALEFGPIASLREAHPEGAAAIGELTDETGPAVVFALHRDADKGGTLRNPQEVGHEA